MVFDGLKKSLWTFRGLSLAIMTICAVLSVLWSPVNARAETRSLKLYYVHTGEKAEIVFKRDGRYDQAGLKRLNVFLRDWRRNEPTNMDPRLFDLIWTVYRASGSREYINVVSAYRSPATNNMLRTRSPNSGVAKNSQHTLGHAMDFYLPDVNLAKLRAIGLKQQVGGVGYYPTSGSPFVHMDVGSVRHWPRMNRNELMALFPDGKTMYIPSDGKPLPGYEQAKADWLARRGAPVLYASATPTQQKRGFFGSLFGKKNQQQETVTVAQAQPQAPAQLRTKAPARVQQVEADGDEDQPMVVALPKKGAPLPETSPLYRKPQQPDAKEDKDDTQNAPVMAYANVPVPTFKPGGLAADNDENNDKTVELASVPIPGTRPEQKTDSDNVAVAIAKADVKTEMPAAKSEETANKVPGDDLTALIQANEIIAVPDDDYEEDEDYADADDAQTPDKGMVASVDNSKNAQSGNVQPAKNAQAVKNTQPAAIPQPTKTTPKADRPDEDDIAKIVANNKASTASKSASNIAPDEELRKVPNVVFVSGIEKKQEVSRVAQLSGKAIDFHAVTRINETY